MAPNLLLVGASESRAAAHPLNVGSPIHFLPRIRLAFPYAVPTRPRTGFSRFSLTQSGAWPACIYRMKSAVSPEDAAAESFRFGRHRPDEGRNRGTRATGGNPSGPNSGVLRFLAAVTWLHFSSTVEGTTGSADQGSGNRWKAIREPLNGKYSLGSVDSLLP